MAVVGAAIAGFSGWFASTAVGSFLTQTIVGRLLASVAFQALSSALQRATAKKQRAPGITTEYTTEGGTRPQSFILGWSATGGHMVCPPMAHGKSGGRHNAWLTYVISLGDIPGQVLDKVYIDNTEVSFADSMAVMPVGGSVPTGRPAWWYQQQGLDPANPEANLAKAPYGRPATGDYEGRAWLRYWDGTQTAADPYLMQVYGPGTKWAASTDRAWQEDMVGAGTCYAILTFKYDTKLYHGLPRCRFVLKGIPLYDPRRDSSVGGSGAQRAGDPATWATSTNAEVIRYNILRGIPIAGGPRWGLGVPDADLPLAAWAPMMNACDEDVDGEPRWRAGLEVTVDSQPLEVLAEIAKVSTGQLAEIGGVWKPRIGPPGAPVYMLTDSEIVASEAATYQLHPGLEDTFNGVHASYPDPAALWEAKDAPPRYNATWEATDGNRRRVAELTMPACPWRRQVQRVMRAYIEEERRFRRHTLTLPPAALILEPLDAIGWSSEENGYIAKIFEVKSVREDLTTGCVTVDLQERDPADYDYRPEFELPSSAPGVLVPRPDDVTPQFFTADGILIEATPGGPQRPAIELRWGGWGTDGLSAVAWELKLGTELVGRGMVHDPSEGRAIVSAGILPLTVYEARVSFLDRAGKAIAWTPWVPVTTRKARVALVEIDDTPPAKVTGLTLSTTLGSVTANWSAMAGAATYDLEITESGGNPVTATTPQTSHRWAAGANLAYSVRVRAVDRVGNRGLYSDPATITSARDTVPPAVPVGLTLTPGFGAIWARWSANAEPDLAGYEVFVAAASAAPAAGTTPTATMMANATVITGLGYDELRYVWVRAFDTSGNRSAWSAGKNARTGPKEAITTADLMALIDATSFAQGIEPVKIVSALPATRETTTVYYNDILYRWSVAEGKYTAATKAEQIVGKLVAGQIAAGAIGVEQLAAGAVTASKVLIGDTTNLLNDPEYGDLDGSWTLVGGATFGTAGGQPTVHYGQDTVLTIRNIPASGSAGWTLLARGPKARAKAEVEYAFEAGLWASTACKLLARVSFYDANDGYLNSIYAFNGDFAASSRSNLDSAKAPPGTAYARAEIYVDRSVSQPGLNIGRMLLMRRNAGDLLVDGAIKGRHLAVDEAVITGPAQIASATITDAHVVDLSAAKLRAGSTLTGSLKVDGRALGEIKGDAESGARDPAGRINDGNTLIEPGRVSVAGSKTVADWRKGGDESHIDGGELSVNTVTANKLEIGSRNITLTGVQFEHNSPGLNRVSWSAGTVRWVNDAGGIASSAIAAGNATWSSGVLYIYWVKGETSFRSTTNLQTAMAINAVCFATYEGGTKLDNDYGRTIVDGSGIKTGTVTAAQLVKTQALITELAQMGDATVDTLTIKGLAATVALSAKGVSRNDITASSGIQNLVNVTATLEEGYVAAVFVYADMAAGIRAMIYQNGTRLDFQDLYVGNPYTLFAIATSVPGSNQFSLRVSTDSTSAKYCASPKVFVVIYKR